MSNKNQAANANTDKKEKATENLNEQQKQTLVVTREVKEETKAGAGNTQVPPSLDIFLARLYDKLEVAKKLEFLKEQKKLLNAFALGDDRMQTRIILEDAAGREWQTSNPVLLHQVFGVCKSVVDEKIKDAEAELLAA